MKKDYRIYMTRSTMQNYLQPQYSNTKEAKRHHHPAQIRLAAVERNEMNDHTNEHYCLASIKGIAAVGKTFKAIQIVNEPVSIPVHDFSKVAKHKLIPSVYLMINSDNTNDFLRSGHKVTYLSSRRGPCETHMVDLMTITEEESFHEFTHYESSVKPIWCLLTDGGPDENS
ncbi:unnamed protein product [Rhizophagus irregularis]|nr:unnamed protein product [Rhizophagus irregularis]